jgi:hypothetical protein
MVGLIGWLSKPRSKTELLIQGREVRDWLQEVEIGGDPDRKNLALETLVAAGPQIVPELSHVLLKFESPKDLAMRLPSGIVQLEKKYGHEHESKTLALKAQAVWVLGAIAYRNPDAQEVSEAIPALISALRSGSPTVRYASAQALGAMGQRASNALPALIARTTDQDSSLRISAVEAIGRIGVNSPTAIAAITLALSDTNRDVSVTATKALQVLKQQ